MSDCCYGVSPVNYPDPDPGSPEKMSYEGGGLADNLILWWWA